MSNSQQFLQSPTRVNIINNTNINRIMKCSDNNAAMYHSPNKFGNHHISNSPNAKSEIASNLGSYSYNGNYIKGSIVKYVQNPYTQVPNRIFIGGIPSYTSEVDLKIFFEQYGMVKDVRLIIDKSSNLKGYGFITYENSDIVRKLLSERDYVLFRGKRLNISSAFRKQKPINSSICEPKNEVDDRQNDSISETNNLPYKNEIVAPIDPLKPDYNNYYPNNIYGNYYAFPSPMYYYQPSINDYLQYYQYMSPQNFSFGSEIKTSSVSGTSENHMTPMIGSDNANYPVFAMDGIKNVMFSPSPGTQVTSPPMYPFWCSMPPNKNTATGGTLYSPFIQDQSTVSPSYFVEQKISMDHSFLNNKFSEDEVLPNDDISTHVTSGVYAEGK